VLLVNTDIHLYLDKLEIRLSVMALLTEVSSLPKFLIGLTIITGKLSLATFLSSSGCSISVFL